MRSPDNISDEELSAFADGHLPQRRAAKVAAYLRRDPAAQAQVNAYIDQDRLIARAFADALEAPVPARLQAANPGGSRRRWPTPALAAAALLLLTATLVWWSLPQSGQPALTQVALDSFRESPSVSTASGPMPEFQPIGFEFAGARMLDAASVTEYRFTNASGQRVGLYVAPRDDVDAAAYRVVRGDGLNVVTWQSAGEQYALVGEQDVAGLTTLAVNSRRPSSTTPIQVAGPDQPAPGGTPTGPQAVPTAEPRDAVISTVDDPG
ncbi:hypothetical protein [Spectribacter hydrogenoxidans]|uniref:Transmembrane transcriptional regulator (Anti-sigma factor RsiW) n=1 Tax=Spectribacter hydrogenoxidans TaxID=3075608 RepID=A0ABU3BXE4_9GAMM|nr:hypothetical protein [Salinisphaera sp. W335]MDT0633992.1 hypothetical protein [Salinisphaera sp. W335]